MKLRRGKGGWFCALCGKRMQCHLARTSKAYLKCPKCGRTSRPPRRNKFFVFPFSNRPRSWKGNKDGK